MHRLSVEISTVGLLYTSRLCKTSRVDERGNSDALAQPTRSRLFALLGELRRPAGTEELAKRVGMHVNGVRRHLERLSEVGLLERRRVSQGPGRPRDEWVIARGAAPGGERPSGYTDLARWLARATPTGPTRLRQVEEAGREIGRELAPEEGDGSMQSFEDVFTALGFEPVVEVGADGDARCRLCNCPYRDSVRETPEVVCTLHRGITAGVLDVVAPRSRLAAFEPHDPDQAGCLVEVAGAEWGERDRAS